ncbi:ATP-binding protein [Haloarcula salinisoli]|uniref:ATP-binding protein n=1 Tax=Haloarcula salinisoli TaxID=2487746 RepID=A0A8J7YM68_9EURY|nr:ATP-binding protein [Halomicroarcula salinisoli]MBX0305769.1 ATP-binding protein [Halomicroarcula salinisoli]
MTENTASAPQSIPRPESEVVSDYIEEGESHIHISGGPGIGKTTTLQQITADIGTDYETDIREIRPNHSCEDFVREVCHSLFDHLPGDKTEEGKRVTGISISAVGGLSWDDEGPDATRAHFGYRDALIELSERFTEDQPLLICVDDIHKLGDNDKAIRGVIEETCDTLPSNVTLLTAGRLPFRDLETFVSLDTFTEEQTATLLRQAFPEIEDEQIEIVHEEVDGHPLYLGLLIESNDDAAALKLPDDEVYTAIEERYLQFLSPDERRILRATAPLRELHEAVCTYVLPDSYDLDRVAVAEILESLSTRTVVQLIGRTHTGLATFKVHDVFREFLAERWGRTEETQQRAFQYYAETSIELADENTELETEVHYITYCLEFLSDAVIRDQTETVSDLIAHVVADDGFSFYPASLLVTAFKTRDAEQIPDSIIEAVFAAIDARNEIANDFYDARLNRTWAERQLEQGAFETPSNILLTYLARITDNDPSFVQRTIDATRPTDERTKWSLISLGTDLPASGARTVGEKAIPWIQETDAYHDLAYRSLELHEHLCSLNEYDTALDLLDVILTPRQVDGNDQLDGNQGMTRYSLIQALEETFPDLCEERPDDLLEVLYTNLEDALRIEGVDGVEYEVLVKQNPVTELDYVDENRGKLKHILLEYFIRAVTTWIDQEPTAADRREFIEELLSGPVMFQRVGFTLLAAHPEHQVDLIETALLDEENYRDRPATFEFYHLLATAFDHLEEDVQAQVCENINNGPYIDVEEKAEQLAQRRDESAQSLEQRLQETWRRDRFCLIQDTLPEPYVAQLEGLLEKHGEPDRVPSEPHQSAVTGGWGAVNERGPEETEELRDSPAEEVLTTAVEWEPPETERWEPDEDGKLEEWTHVGFSRQIRDLIEEQPERYAREISILKDANPRYAEAAFRAFRELLDEGQTFPWSSIIALGTVIADDPVAWSTGSRTRLAMLLNKGMAVDETPFPEAHADEVRDILLVLVTDTDPDQEQDQPAEGVAGHGDPVRVAINSVRPMALNALITYAWWDTDQGDNDLEPVLRDAIEKRITEDQSLAVRTVIGRRFGTLWELDRNLVEQHLDTIFPRGESITEQRRFIAAWNSFTSHNVMWGYDVLRSYYSHAIELLDYGEDDAYEINVGSTATHVVSSYLFGEDSLSDDESLIARYYRVLSPEEATEVARTLANAIGKPEVEEQWDSIRTLWDWRLDQLVNAEETEQRDHADEMRRFLDCVRESSATDIAQEHDRVRRSLSHVSTWDPHWRRIEEWIAGQSNTYPEISMELYGVLVEAAVQGDWSSAARTSQESHRKQIYEHAADASEEALQSARSIANHFAAERCEMDREFLNETL